MTMVMTRAMTEDRTAPRRRAVPGHPEGRAVTTCRGQPPGGCLDRRAEDRDRRRRDRRRVRDRRLAGWSPGFVPRGAVRRERVLDYDERIDDVRGRHLLVAEER